MKSPKICILAYNKSKRIQYLKKPKEKKNCFLLDKKQKYRLEEKKNRKLEMGNR